MGLFDYFEPDPPIGCLKCKSGVVRGWQCKHSEHALFLWRQGYISPVDQPIDEDCKISDEVRSRKRLPCDEELSIYGGDCDSCGALFPFHLDLKFTDVVWTGFTEGKSVKYAAEIEDGWLQCPECMNAFELAHHHFAVACSDCKILLIQGNP